ncbi:hypothetical protein [Nitrosospira briensis]|uniref:hypothetical protein n=1 Tax=Nitrosospira briensis TaxID=35799 RepID=UPI0008DFE88E|nr:hypothetical protein [Nitrosospira briensis]SFO14079.1 hypothetical protein SAMN05216332_1063 [Nitrosospira briensis]
MHLTWIGAILAIVMLTGFTGFWGPKSFEECRDRAARDAKTDAGVKALILGCRERFPKQSQLQNEWLEFSKELVGYKFDPNVPITRKTPRSTEISRAESTKGKPSSRTNNSKRSWVLTEEESRRLEELAEDGAYQSTPSKVKLLKSVEFINWFVSQPDHIKSLLVIPMLEKNERSIFDAYRWR